MDNKEQPDFTFSLFDKVYKPMGYPFPGQVVAVFMTRAGKHRYVVEHECGDLLHIFNDTQLTRINDRPTS